MRFGIATIIWGRRIDDLDYALDVIAKCGYRGVEFAQHHSQIYVKEGDFVRPIRDIDELLERMGANGRNLKLIGMVEGSLRERMDFLKEPRDTYLYLDRWPKDEDKAFHEEITECIDKGFTIALHPHWLMQIRKLRHATDIIRRVKSDNLRLLLDTAHGVIAEDDLVKAVEDDECFKMIGAIHLKDWRPDFGRWSHRYAHGFCLPGGGIVQPERVLDALHAKSFQGWVVLEQDHYAYRRETTLLEGAQWMERNGPKWGVTVQPDAEWVRVRLTEAHKNPFLQSQEVEQRAFLLGKELSRSVSPFSDAAKFYFVVADTVRQIHGAVAVKVWWHNPMTGDFCLLGMSAEIEGWKDCEGIIRDRFPTGGLTLAGKVVSHPHICQKDLWNDEDTKSFGDNRWLQTVRSYARWMTVLPVFNSSNKHQLRFLITLFTARSFLDPASDTPNGGDADEESKLKRENELLLRAGELDRLGWIVVHWADYLTDQACSAVSGATNHLCGNFQGSVSEFTSTLIVHLRRIFYCNQVTIFLKDITGKRLRPAGDSDEYLDWTSDEHSYLEGDGHTGAAFKEREMVFDSRATTGTGREKRRDDDHRNEILFAPLVRWNGECHGVVRLHNKDRKEDSPVATMFTDDDAARLDAVIQTALPYLEILMMKENQANGVVRMIHEFQTPLVAIRGAVDAMRTDIRKAGKKPTDFFRRDFPDLIVRWANLVGRLARNWRIFAAGKGSLPLKQRKLSLRAEVIMPVVDQVRGLLASGGRLEFECRGFDEIPQLWIDRDQFEQVFFNLLSNSCKYGGGMDTVRVDIVAKEVSGNYCISYSDLGRGISEDIRERIFEPGFRAQDAVFSEMSGQGLGLFVVRSVIQAHGGTICLTSCSQPTRFEIVLPRSLRDAPSVVRARSQGPPES